MKPDIHPAYVETQVTCTCGNTFTTRSTAPNGVIHADVCSACHPFYTGKQKILDTGGRVARFEKRYAAKQPAKKPTTSSCTTAPGGRDNPASRRLPTLSAWVVARATIHADKSERRVPDVRVGSPTAC